MIQTHDARLRYVEIGIVRSGHGIAQQSVLEFWDAFDSSRYD
ncbi:MAG TPA: hypothetical protein VMM16_12495 [Verrucomicrobiae bacterium]|nr:hypothetical protein [Verrucomicrobiae bacterium]